MYIFMSADSHADVFGLSHLANKSDDHLLLSSELEIEIQSRVNSTGVKPLTRMVVPHGSVCQGASLTARSTLLLLLSLCS